MFIQEGATNYASMTARRRLNADHQIEKVGAQLRSMMPWIAKNKLVDQDKKLICLSSKSNLPEQSGKVFLYICRPNTL